MKMTKKIISILLAVMLVIGSVAVAASAEMLTEKTGTVLTYTATVKGKTANADGAIEVEPGEKITVEVYTQANYYLGSVGSELFAWTTTFFDTPATADYHIHNHINNYTPNKKAGITGAQLGSNYKEGYTGYLFGRAINVEYTTPTDASTPVLSYSFDFTVSDAVTAGTTGKFVMPEQMLGLETTKPSTFRMIYCSVASNGTDYNSQGDASKFPETINVSGAVINFVVKSAESSLDYTELNAQMARFDAEDYTKYTSASWDAASDAYNVAYATKLDAEATQDEINAAAAALKDALNKLELLQYCSYTALQQAVNYCSDLDSAEEYYDPTDLATWKAALKAAQDLLAADKLVLTDANQAIIDNAAQALADAYDELYEMYVDTSALSAAITAYKTPAKAPEFYDSAKYEAWQAALEAAQDGVIDYDGAADTEANRAEVAGLAADLKAAFEALTANYVDTTALAEAIAAYGSVGYAAEYYDAAEYEAWTDALTTANTALNSLAQAADTAENRAAVAEFAADLKTAYEALDARFVDLSALENAERDYHNPGFEEEWFDPEEYAAWEAALEAVHQAKTTYANAPDTAENRDAVAKLAADLIAAHNELDPRSVDVSALEAALALTPEYDAEYYNAAAFAAWQDAVVAGSDVYEEMKDGGAPDTEANRKAVADAADAITAAFRKLIPEFIDYSALEEAVEAYGETPEAADDYTPATYEPYAAALERAQNMLNDKNENAPASDTQLQAAIDAAAEELKATFEALEIAPVEPPVEPEEPALTIVTAVRSTEEFYEVGDTVNFEFDCAITNVTKLQIVFTNGTTLTYHRAHSSVVSIDDNGNGTETWTIAVPIYHDNMDASARGKLDKIWEDEGFEFAFETKTETSEEDFKVKSAEVLLNDVAVNQFTAKDTVILKIVCGPDTLRIRLVDQTDGGTSTYDRSRAAQDENGNWVWAITRTFAKREYKYDIYTAGSSNHLTDEGTDLGFTVSDKVAVNGPSTGNNADIVVSAAVAKARLVRDAEQTFTIVTDKNATGVRVDDQYGNVLTYSKDVATATDNGDGTLTWTIKTTCTVANTFDCTVYALYGSSWMNNGTTVSYRVVY